MKLASPRIEALRDRLLRRGQRSIAPRQWSLSEAPPGARAAYQRILPFAETIYLVIAADGLHTPEERDALLGAIRYLTDGELGTQAANHMVERFQADLEREGLETRLDDVASHVYREPEDRELALALAAAAAVATGAPGPGEEVVVKGLAERLGFSPKKLQALLDQGQA